MQSNKNNLYSILEQIRIRKAMYLGNDYTFKSLDAFISGFMFAAPDDQLEIEGAPNFSYFNTWILGHIETHFGLSGGWHWQIKNRNTDDDEKAFDDFFQILEIFKQAKMTKKSLIVDQAALEYAKLGPVKRYSLNGDYPLLEVEKPSKIICSNLSNSSTTWIEYLSENGKIIHEFWKIDCDTAMEELDTEFGTFQNKWIEYE